MPGTPFCPNSLENLELPTPLKAGFGPYIVTGVEAAPMFLVEAGLEAADSERPMRLKSTNTADGADAVRLRICPPRTASGLFESVLLSPFFVTKWHGGKNLRLRGNGEKNE